MSTLVAERSLAPIIESKRLILRAYGKADLPDAIAIWQSEEVYRYIGGQSNTPTEVWSKMLNYMGQWALLGYGFWCIEHKQSGQVIGEIGFADFKRGLIDELAETPEAGWVLHPDFHGKGYASEALEEVLSWGKANLPAKQCHCMIRTSNVSSLKLARKFGFQLFKETAFKEVPVTISLLDL